MGLKFLVTGSTGIIGSQVVKDLTNQNYKVYSCYHNQKPEHGKAINLDLAEEDKIKKTLRTLDFNYIIHLAAMTNVDQCETNPDLALTINGKSTETLSKIAAKQNAFFIYVSTDYVFDGKDGMRNENHIPNPLGIYGKTKLAGEKFLENLPTPYSIIRTSTPFGCHKFKQSFPIWVKENLEIKKEIPVLIDQFTSPTYIPHLSKMVLEVAIRKITGIIHLAGATRISRFNFAEIIAEKLNLDKKLLIPTKMNEMHWKAPRPKDSSLDVSLATKILNEKPHKLEESLTLFFTELKK